MKLKLYCILCLLLILPVCLPARSDTAGPSGNKIPEFFNKYLNDSGIFVTEIYEYSDVVIIVKRLKQGDRPRNIRQNGFFVMNESSYTGLRIQGGSGFAATLTGYTIRGYPAERIMLSPC